ncbi:hypothetical protein [Neobacillus terrae]|uniref:hypothetical protein n=1 Tax=Neobacillus terrae TaxID=3034837 RepID=UPI00140C14A0|nr:hypothetical protein [Neobacillus terrae]NHM32704.1 hypothetical protein [Neobacillus terrae]
MAKSTARKWRDKLVREGRRNPEESRSPFAAADMQTRVTKTKKDYLYRCKHKNQPLQEGKDGSFYFPQIFPTSPFVIPPLLSRMFHKLKL